MRAIFNNKVNNEWRRLLKIVLHIILNFTNRRHKFTHIYWMREPLQFHQTNMFEMRSKEITPHTNNNIANDQRGNMKL